MIRRNLLTLAAALLAAAALPPSASAADDGKIQLTAENVDKAIERGIAYLWSIRHKEGHWEVWSRDQWAKQFDPEAWRGYNGPGQYTGGTALALMALHKSGASQDDERFEKAVKLIAEIEPSQTYARGLRGALWASLGRPRVYHKLMEREKDWLLGGLYADGSYGYYAPPNNDIRMLKQSGGYRDYSNTQYGLLGTWLLSDAGIEVPHKYWELVGKGYLKNQGKDGGWGYHLKDDQTSTATMTLGALAGLYIVWDKLYAADCNRAPDRNLVNAIARGLDWMGKNYTHRGSHGNYIFYGIERVGVAGGLKYFGEHDWWKAGATHLLRTQKADGGWGGEKGDRYDLRACQAAWALLFLSYGRGPVVFNKLAYGPQAQWNSRPRDLAHLTAWMNKAYERLFNWQVMPVDKPVHELLDAPILLMSGTRPIRLDDAQKRKLKEYILGGGLLLGEAAGNSKAFADSFRALMAELFPRLELTPLPDDHPVYTIQFKLDPPGRGSRTPPLEGLGNGIRTFALLCPRDLGCAWQRYDIAGGKADFELAGNLMMYVSDRGTGLLVRGSSYGARDLGHTPAAAISVGRLIWPGDDPDKANPWQWNPEPAAWEHASIHLRNEKIAAATVTPTILDKPLDPKAVPLLHLTGRGELKLSEKQQLLLKAYCDGGGLLLVDPAGGDEAFLNSFRKLAGDLFAPLAPAVPDWTAAATDDGKAAYRHVGRLPRVVLPLEMQGVKNPAGHWSVLLLPHDLTAALVGYPNVEPAGLTPESARRLVAELVKSRLPAKAN